MDTAYDFVVCVYCEREHPLHTRVCTPCHEYKGIMTVEAWEDYMGTLWDAMCDCHTGNALVCEKCNHRYCPEHDDRICPSYLA